MLQLVANATLRGIYALSRLLGLMAATMPQLGRNGGRGVRSVWYWRLHGYLVAGFVVCYSPHAIYMIYTRMHFLRQNRLLLIVGLQHYVLLLVSTFIMLYMHTTRQMCFIGWLNKLLSCRRQLLKLLHTSRTQLKDSAHSPLHSRQNLCVLFLLTAAIIGSGVHSGFILIHDPMAHRSARYFGSVLFFYGLQLGLQLCLALYLLVLLLLSHLLHHCNLLLQHILTDALHTHRTHLGMWGMPQRRRLHAAQQHWLSLELWRLWRLHNQLWQLSQHLCSLHSSQLLIFVVFVPIECVMHGFFTYFVHFSRWFAKHNLAHPKFNAFGLLFISSLFLQLTLVIVETHRQRLLYCETRRSLRSAALELPTDCSKALRQTIELYGLQLQLNERINKLSACGLFELNNGLLFGIIQTIIIYIMILIQFDKIIYT
ncbi:hypothetical protein KR044_001559 [Drosophila immigrans]|nr:hypothetical protein KR044_001559 [Drosophila immigrans]